MLRSDVAGRTGWVAGDDGGTAGRGEKIGAQESRRTREGLTEGVDDTVGLLCNARETTGPLSSITEVAYTFDLVWAVERGREEVP